MKKKKLPLIILSIVILATIYFFSSSDDVVYKDLTWKSRDGVYTASFTVNNKTKNYIGCKASIRAYRNVHPRQSQGESRLCGEKIIEIKLRPEESMKLSEVVDVTFRPIMFNVNIFDIKTE